MALLKSLLSSLMTIFRPWPNRIAKWILVLWVCIFGGGLTIFPIMISRLTIPSWKKTDAIIIFTGEIDREKTAIRLYHSGLAPKLHISGRYQGFRCSKSLSFVTFDTAKTTEKNVVLSYRWMVKNHIRSVRLVTADYHMPRCLLLTHQYWKNIEIVPHPVAINKYKGQKIIFIVLAEYCRYIKSLMLYGYATMHKFSNALRSSNH